MFSVLLSGKLTKDPKPGVGRNGQPYCTASIRVPVQGQKEDEPDFAFASVIAFGEEAEKLSRLLIGDAVSVAGSARLSQWERDGRQMTGLNVTASGILSAYDRRKRSGESERQSDDQDHTLSYGRLVNPSQNQPAEEDFSDDLRF